jgi:hypothetical protein
MEDLLEYWRFDILEYDNDRRGVINNWSFNIIKVIKQRCFKTTSVDMPYFLKAGGQGTTL